ncbi:hypothetical protein Vadar_024386 [Vaccinium darrowii]|uniref:Uncharacterized protein n=1 Tax=Vaccinium darrowii TaxID=229202 RepID=A0ACB7X3L1_9ERIC|nr:hypothetical protein Vadar_024386 [Vaccinium darrowii]
METEGRGYSDFYRNTSEDLFFKSLMESSIGMPTPSMEMISTELASLTNPQLGGVLQKKRSNEFTFPQNTHMADEQTSDLTQNTMRTAVDKGLQASNLYLAKAWFHSSKPMTRSRSSELRRRYVAMQNSQTPYGMEAMHNVTEHAVNNLKQEFGNPNPNAFANVPMFDNPNQFNSFMSPPVSSSSAFNTPNADKLDNISSVVSMLKGTLERKKLTNTTEREAVKDSSLGHYCAQEGQGNYVIRETPRIFQDVSSVQVNNTGVLHSSVNQSLVVELEGFTNPTQKGTLSREPSQSESSAAAPVLSTGFDACDGPSNSGQNMSESSRKQHRYPKSSENGSIAKDIRERIYDDIKADRKQNGSLVRYGSMNSVGSELNIVLNSVAFIKLVHFSLTKRSIAVGKGDPTKKRRVERSRKMAEAKERNLTPSIPSDMQSILKRCDNLEKEVRSLKLNLSFMNRKDSEQTKQIEELQKQNDELTEEKERLLEEIERIIGQTVNM